jgi:hypothetical protein
MGHGGLKGCDILRISHCVDNWLTDGGEAVSLTCQPHSTSQKHIPGNHLVSGSVSCRTIVCMTGKIR